MQEIYDDYEQEVEYMVKLTITENEDKQRLDRFLKKYLKITYQSIMPALWLRRGRLYD